MNLKKLKIGIATYGASFQRVGGIQVQIAETMNALRSLGLEVEVINDYTEKLTSYDLIHVFAVAHANYVWVNEANRQKVPVICSPVFQPNYSKLQLYKIQLFRLLSKLLLSDIAGENVFSSHKYTSKALNEVSQVVVQSEKEKKAITRIFNLPSQKCNIISNGASPHFFKTSLNDKKDNYIFIPGAIYAHKNQYTSVRLAHELGYDAILAGEILDKSYYKKILSEFKNVKYAGVLEPQSEEFLSLYTNATATALLSHSETFGLVAIESLATGTPVIMTENTGLISKPLERYILKVDPTQPSKIIEQSRIFLEQKFIASNLRDAVSSFSWSEIAVELKNVYEMVLAETRNA